MWWRWGLAQWFELRWWRNYLRKKDKTEYLNWKKKYWKRIISLLSFPISPTDRIADLGCGPAGIFILFSENKITAVDPLLDKYEAETSIFNRRDYPAVNFVQHSLEDFESDEKFDVVFCLNAINHVKNIERGIETLKEVCSDNGAIVLSIDAHNYKFFKYLFRLLPVDILHPHQYDLKGYKRMLRKNDWKVSVPYLLEQGFFFNHYMLICRRALPQ